VRLNPPTSQSESTRLQKYWLSPDAELYELDGFIHEQWARLAIGWDIAAPMPQEGGLNAKEKLFDLGWVRVAVRGTESFSVELQQNASLKKNQLARLILLAKEAGAKILVRERNDRMESIWCREKCSLATLGE